MKDLVRLIMWFEDRCVIKLSGWIRKSGADYWIRSMEKSNGTVKSGEDPIFNGLYNGAPL